MVVGSDKSQPWARSRPILFAACVREGPFGHADRLLTAADAVPNVSYVSSNAVIAIVVVAIVPVLLLSASIRIVQQYQRGVHFRLGRVIGVREPGLRFIIPIIDRLWRVSMRI